MAYTNTETQKLLGKKIEEFEETINTLEKEIQKDGDAFDKAKISFHYGRLQERYIQINELMKNLKYIT